MTRPSRHLSPADLRADLPPLDCVDTRQGTDSDHDFSTGNTLPLVTVPHGMVGWTPQTAATRWIFDRRAAKLQGFRATRQASPWLGDYGEFLVTVASGSDVPDRAAVVDSSYDRDATVAQPHYFRTRLLRHDVVAEIAPTLHGGHLRFTFNRAGDAWIAFQPGRGEVVHVDEARGLVTGYSTSNQGGVPDNFRAHFVAEVGAKILATGRFPLPGTAPDGASPGAGLWLKLRRPRDGVVTVRTATSFIDAEQARLALGRELGRAAFERTKADARALWDDRLGVIAIEGATLAQRRTFYGCLYRCFCFPRRLDETDSAGRQVHYSPFDGKVHPGPLYSDHCFWDGYRALMPLLSLIAPDTLGEMLEGWLNVFREGGWLPNCASPGYRACMVGSHSTAVIADAWLKGIRNFDADTALAALLKDAREDSGSRQFGRAGLSAYVQHGYVPADAIDHATARTLDYAHADFAVDQFARALGRGDETRDLARRALSYREVFDRRTGFFRGRLADGKWRKPFSPFAWSVDFIEGSAWQYRFSVPHDPAGLIALHGGDRNFVARLDAMLAQPPRFETDFYPFEIHEMTEMAAVPFGQYAHSNEPVHHVLWLYACAGRPDRTQHWVRRVVDELYSPDKFPGDEDTGAMGAWYVLATLGIFPLTCGHPGYVLGAPRFRAATVKPPGGREFRIVARGGRGEKLPPFASAVRLGGRAFDRLELPHAAIAEGGELIFTMTSDARAAAARGRLPKPFSASA